MCRPKANGMEANSRKATEANASGPSRLTERPVARRRTVAQRRASRSLAASMASSTTTAPLLFARHDRNKAKGRRRSSAKVGPGRGSSAPAYASRRQSTACDGHYPMFVMSIDALLSLTEILPHQKMLCMGLLQEVTPVMDGRIIFVSHVSLSPSISNAPAVSLTMRGASAGVGWVCASGPA